ncbi:MAG: hypothetical protein ABS903_17780 [Solibacillus sp.]
MRVQVNEHLSSVELRELGYRLSVIEGGYISKDGATIIHLFRKPYYGEVSQYKSGVEKEHEANVQQLREQGYLEEK